MGGFPYRRKYPDAQAWLNPNGVKSDGRLKRPPGKSRKRENATLRYRKNPQLDSSQKYLLESPLFSHTVNLSGGPEETTDVENAKALFLGIGKIHSAIYRLAHLLKSHLLKRCNSRCARGGSPPPLLRSGSVTRTDSGRSGRPALRVRLRKPFHS